jgi:hypothetical protein
VSKQLLVQQLYDAGCTLLHLISHCLAEVKQLLYIQWGHKSPGLVGSLGIAVVHPLLDKLAHMGQQAKQVGGELFAAEQAIEALDVIVFSLVCQLHPMQRHLLLTPLVQTGTNELGTTAYLRSCAGRSWHLPKHVITCTT